MIRVLVVDDSDVNLHLLRTVLEGSGCEVETARNGAEALAKAQENPPQLAVSDLLMPVMDGYTLLRHWKADPRLRRIPVIVQTSTYVESKDEQLARDLGADAFIPKSADPEEFLAGIRRVLADVESGALSSPRQPAIDGAALLENYSEALVRKLEEKMDELEALNRTLEHDIAERRKAQDELSERERLLRAVFQTEPECVKIVAPDGGILDMNEAGLAMIEVDSVEDIRGASCLVFVAPEYHSAFGDLHRRVMQGERGILEFESVGKKGIRRWLESHAAPLRDSRGKIIALLAVTRDVTERKRAEIALREKEGMLSEAQRIAHLGSWAWDLATNAVTWSDETYRIYGVSPDTFVPSFSSLLGLIHPENRGAMREWIGACGAGQKPGDLEFRAIRPDGVVRVLNGRGRLIVDDAGVPVRAVGTVQDITERKETEEARTRLATAVEQAAEAIMITDPAGTILFVNPAFEKTTGFPRQEAIGRNPRILKSGKHEAAFYREMWDTLARGGVWAGRIANKRKDGLFYEAENTISPVRDSAGRTVNYVAVMRDVTQELALENQLRQIQKMESIGHLAGGVAHDFNNILTVIQGNASILLMPDVDQAEKKESAQQIVEAAERAANLTRQLLAFSRKQIMQPVHLHLNEVVGNMTKMLQRILGEDITLHSDYAPELPMIHADAGMIEQVLLNLAVNSRDAMPSGGHLTVSTKPESVDEERVKQNPEAAPGQCVCLSVTDTGSGIPPEILPHIFEPFFTTKEAGKGTGLGLATVYGIVKQHRGWIEVTTRPGVGTTFRIYLPAAEASGIEQVDETTAADLPCGAETLLVVEDDPSVRLIVVNVLRRCGYTVLEASSGVAALEVWNQGKEAIQLLFTDVVMPEGMSGLELARRLQAEKPELKVICSTGYSAELVTRQAALPQGSVLLQKPHDPHRLAQLVRDCLDRA